MTTATPVLPVVYGHDPSGRPVAVDLTGPDPHILIAGAGGAGRTTLAGVIAAGAGRNGGTVRACFPRPEDDTWTRGVPGITVSRGLEETMQTIAEAHAEMYRRFDDAESGRIRLGAHPCILLAIDDYSHLALVFGARVRDAAAALAEIAALGRAARVTLLVVAHGSGVAVPAEVLENFGTRIVLGHATQATALRLLGDQEACRDVPAGPGNGTAVTGGSLPAAVRVLPSPEGAQP